MSSGAFISGSNASEWYPTLPGGHGFFLMAASSSVEGGADTQNGLHYTPVFVTPDYDVLPLWGSDTLAQNLSSGTTIGDLPRGVSAVVAGLSGGATREIRLPRAAEMRGQPIFFRHIGNGSGTLTIQVQGGEYLDGVLDGTRDVTHLESVIIIGHVQNDGTGRYTTYISDDAFKSLTGPSITTDNAIARWDGTTGSILQNSSVIVSDGGDVYIPWAVTASHVALDHLSSNTVVVTGSRNIQITPGQFNGGSNVNESGNRSGFILVGGNNVDSDQGDGGEITIWPFNGSGAGSDGGPLYLFGANGQNGGKVSVQPGWGRAYGAFGLGARGGDVEIFASSYIVQPGVSSPTSASAGDIRIGQKNFGIGLEYGKCDVGGKATDIEIFAGRSPQFAAAGDVYIAAGGSFNDSGGSTNLPTSDAGAVIIEGGLGGGQFEADYGGQNGGFVIIKGGAASTNNNASGSGGSVYIDGGEVDQSGKFPSGIGPNGNVYIGTKAGSEGLFQVTKGNTNRSYQFGQTANVFIGSGSVNPPIIYLGYDDNITNAFSDSNIVFSGSVGTKDSSTPGTSTFIGDVVVSGTLYADGGRKLSRVSAAGTYNLDRSKNIVGCDTSGGAVTVNLFDPASISPSSQVDGYTVIIKDEGGNASTNAITINRGGSSTIDGNTSLVLNIDYSSVTLYCSTTNWFIT
jgi:hypothetical protein